MWEESGKGKTGKTKKGKLEERSAIPRDQCEAVVLGLFCEDIYGPIWDRANGSPGLGR